MAKPWNALILAAGRGPDDPMAKAYGVANKCTIPIAGKPMLLRVAEALETSGVIGPIAVSIEDPGIVSALLGDRALALTPAHSAPASVMAALGSGKLTYPVLVTTGDHALLTPDMVRHFCAESAAIDADFTAGLATAVAVFGITGVGATELFMYPYWCVEKGYARFVGPNDGSPSRLARARGWIRLMHADVAASMVLYSLATIAFYLLGAGVLSPLGLVPSAGDMIPTLSRLYTDTLGMWVLPLFYLGATVTLYGTIFAATAAHSRLYADLCRILGLFDRADYARRLAWRRRATVLLAVVPVLLYLLFESPVKMVVAGGISQSVMLPITGAGALYLHHRRLPRELKPGRAVTLGLWVATLVMAAVTVYSLVALAGGR